jgi:hypothetical protein
MFVNIKAMLLVSLSQFCLYSACTVFMHLQQQMFDASWLFVYLTDMPVQAKKYQWKIIAGTFYNDICVTFQI